MIGFNFQTKTSVQFSRSVLSNSSQPCGLQHTRPPCPSPTPEAYSNSCPWSWWCHPNISSSVVPFFSRLQSFPASGSFQMSLLFAWGGQSIGVSASALILPMNIQDWFPLGWTSWIYLLSKGLSRVFSSTTLKNFPVCCDLHKGFGVINKADVFLVFSAFLMIHWMLAIWSLVPLPFLNPAWTSESSWFTYCWSLAWRILSIS